MSLRMEVEFARRPAVFLPGEEVNGRLLVHVAAEEVRLRVLRVRVDGSAQTFLKEQTPGVDVDNCSEDGRHAARHELLHAEVALLPPARCKRPHRLARGTHPFPFACALPAETPGSLRLPHGAIRYGVQGTAAPHELLAHAVTCWAPLEVRPLLLVTNRPALHRPEIVTGAVADRELTNRGYTLRLSQRGVTPGDTAELELHASGALLARLAAEPGLLQLVQVVQYRPHGARLAQRTVLAREWVPGERSAGWGHVELRVPADAPHTVPPEVGGVLSRTFHLRVNTKLLQARVPLVIGTVPDEDPPPPLPLPLPPEDPPPTYEEAMQYAAACRADLEQTRDSDQ